MKTFCFSICLICGLISCENRKLQNKLELFVANEIIVPEGMRQMAASRDSLILNPTTGVVRLIVWVDSVACSSCRLSQMAQYNDVIKYSNETNGKFIPIFLFSPSRLKIREVTLMLEIAQFNYPIFLDEKGLFSFANPHIPSDNRFHTFLLDNNGKVALVGDPVNNSDLWILYKKTIAQLIENSEISSVGGQ